MPVLDTVSEIQLLQWISLVTDELVSIEERFIVENGIVVDKHDEQQAQLIEELKEAINDPPKLVLGNHEIRAVTFVDEET